MSELQFDTQKNNANITVTETNLSPNPGALNTVNAAGIPSLITIASIIGIVGILAIVIPLTICLSGNNKKNYTKSPLNSTDYNEKDNYIIANYIIVTSLKLEGNYYYLLL